MTRIVEKTCLCFVIVDEKILLLKRINTWYENNKYLPPGGLVDKNEDIKAATIRETFEETGISVTKNDLVLIQNFQNESNERFFDNYYFLARECTGTLHNKEPNRHSDIGWFSISDLPHETSNIVYDTLKLI